MDAETAEKPLCTNQAKVILLTILNLSLLSCKDFTNLNSIFHIHSGDYGVLMLKFMEIHNMNHLLKDVITDVNMQYHRNQYAAEMYDQYMDP